MVTEAATAEEIRDREGMDKILRFLDPIGWVMLVFAGIIDISEAFIELIPYIGQVISVGIDFLAIVIIGSWMFLHSGVLQVKVPKKTKERIAKGGRLVKRFKWLKPLAIVIEFIPIVGSVAPLWIWLVWDEMKEGG